MIRFRLAAPRLYVLTVNPAPMRGHTSISRYEIIAMMSRDSSCSAHRSTSGKKENGGAHSRQEGMRGKKKPKVLTSSMIASL